MTVRMLHLSPTGESLGDFQVPTRKLGTQVYCCPRPLHLRSVAVLTRCDNENPREREKDDSIVENRVMFGEVSAIVRKIFYLLLI